MRALYISYDGASDPLGRSQVLPYVFGFVRQGADVTLLTFEKRQVFLKERPALKELIGSSGVKWVPLTYHKRPVVLSTFFDVLAGIARSSVLLFFAKRRFDIVHARGYVAGLIALFLKRVFGVKFIFDMRGLWAEEKADAGAWKRGGRVYRATKYFEKRFLLGADAVVVLTKKSAGIIQQFPYLAHRKPDISVIPTCVDLEAFRPGSGPQQRGGEALRGKFLLVYSGSLGTWYMLEEMAEFFSVLRESVKDAHFLFLTPFGRDVISPLMAQKGIPEGAFTVKSVPYAEVPSWLSLASMSIFFIRPDFSKQSSCPTKLGESLACGLPVIANKGIGDVDEIIGGDKIGILVDEFARPAYASAVRKVVALLADKEALRRQCRAAAEEIFSLDKATERYMEIYRQLSKPA